MAEKISDSNIRLGKIERLKKKVQNEVNEMVEMFNEDDIKYDYKHRLISNQMYADVISNLFTAFKLNEFIQKGFIFSSVNRIYYDRDYVIYTIPTELIDVWLMDIFHFTQTLIRNMKNDGNDNVFDYLDAVYFRFNFTNYYYISTYRNRLKEE